jgi:hypothetical protein
MENRFREVVVRHVRLDPVEAELWLSVYPERLSSATQVIGRLMGPRCAYATTIEVAYPLRETGRQYESEGEPRLDLRAIIPEPSLWDPESPFLYEGPVELWVGKERCDRTEVRYGLRHFTLGPRGLRWNGRFLTLRGHRIDQPLEGRAEALRQAGINTLLAPVSPENVGLWDAADRFGFLVLGRLSSRQDISLTQRFREHASCLGWLVTDQLFQDEIAREVWPTLLSDERQLVGMEFAEPPREPPPKGVSFIACSEALGPALADLGLHTVILGRPSEGASDMLGWIDLNP